MDKPIAHRFGVLMKYARKLKEGLCITNSRFDYRLPRLCYSTTWGPGQDGNDASNFQKKKIFYTISITSGEKTCFTLTVNTKVFSFILAGIFLPPIKQPNPEHKVSLHQRLDTLITLDVVPDTICRFQCFPFPSVYWYEYTRITSVCRVI